MPISDSAVTMFGLMAVACVLMAPGIIIFARGARENALVKARLAGDQSRSSGASSGDNNSFQRWMRDLGGKAAPGDVAELSVIRMRLVRAGYLGKPAVSWYYGARFIAVVIPQIALFIALPWMKELPQITPLASSLVLAVVSLSLPSIYLGKRIAKRQLEYFEGFPDMMDLLVACVEAGLSLDAAIVRVAEELSGRYPNLALQLRIISLELQAGRSRKDAWRNFSNRLELEEAGSLVTMLRQAEEMGSSLGETLRVFSRDMRQRRMLSAEEKAMALPAKLTLPLILFVFPTLLGVLMLPAIVQMGDVLKSI